MLSKMPPIVETRINSVKQQASLQGFMTLVHEGLLISSIVLHLEVDVLLLTLNCT